MTNPSLAVPTLPAPPSRLAVLSPARAKARAEAIALAQAGKSWQAVPVLLSLLGGDRHDAQVRLHLAATYVRLGLTSHASLHLSELAKSPLAGSPLVAAVRAAAGKLASDVVDETEQRRNLETNVRAVMSRMICGAELLATAAAGPLPRLLRARTAVGASGCLEVALLCRHNFADETLTSNADPSDEPIDDGWLDLSDGQQARASIHSTAMASVRARGQPWTAPVYITCTPGDASLPVLLEELEKLLPEVHGHCTCPWVIVAPDADWLAAVLSLRDLSALLGHRRVRVLAGPGAIPSLRDYLMTRLDTQVEGPVIGRQGRGQIVLAVAQIAGTIAAMIAEVNAAAVAEQQSVAARIKQWGEQRSAAVRLNNVRSVAIPTTRFSTFLQHSARDLAEAFERRGVAATVLIEPDDTTTSNVLAFERALDSLRPDAVVMLNYTRSTAPRVVPESVPIVTYIQDAMPQLFSKAAGAGVGPRDWLVGQCFRELITAYGYPLERCIHAPVVASVRKFHDQPCDAALLERHRCDIAYVSHQSETPPATLARFIADARSNPDPIYAKTLPAVIEALYGEIATIVKTCDQQWLSPALHAAVCRAYAHVQGPGSQIPGETASQILASIAMPLADRLLRHSMLQWAAEIAEQRGYRLHLYGRGWEKHPTLSRFAKGELAHGEDLRASYQAAGVHLHAAVGSYQHQRVIECALSGGLPLVRRKREDLGVIEDWVSEQVVRDCQPDRQDLGLQEPRDRERAWTAVVNHPLAMEYASICQRIGLPLNNHYPDAFHLRDWGRHDPRYAPRSLTNRRESVMLLGDIAETTFASKAELEALLTKAIGDCAWRASRSGWIARNARASCTTDAVVEAVVSALEN